MGKEEFPAGRTWVFQLRCTRSYGSRLPSPDKYCSCSRGEVRIPQKKRTNNAVHVVLAQLCQLLEREDENVDDSAIFLSVLKEDEETNMKDGKATYTEQEDDPVILETTLGIRVPNDQTFQGACVESGTRLTIVGLGQAKAYCREYGGVIKGGKSRKTFRFGNKKNR